MTEESPKAAPAETNKVEKFQGTVPPLDFSFMNLTTFEDCLNEEPRKSPKKIKNLKNSDGKSTSKTLKLCNNSLADYSTLWNATEQLLERPIELAWLDLSFNELTTIDEILLKFENLHILYLHGNHITDIKEVDKLARLKSLRKLSLHGNAIEQIKHYRLYVIEKLPQLLQFDFSMITKAERRTATTIKNMTNTQTRQKKADKDN